MADPDTGGGLDRRTAIVSGAALAGVAAAGSLLTTVPEPVVAMGRQGLRARADRKGLLTGTAVPYETFDDPHVRAAMIEDCNVIVPENELKWSRLQPTRDSPLRFSSAEYMYAWAHAHDIAMRGTTLHWWNAVPPWAKDYVATLTPGQAGDLLQTYVHDVVAHWKGRLIHWDVVNEEVGGNGQFNDKIFVPKLGERALDLCFDVVRDTDPGTLRVYNINYVEQEANYDRMMRPQVVKQLERLLKRGVPVQCLGIQGHLQTLSGFSQAHYRAFLDEVAAMGLKTLVTELDVSDRGTNGSIAARDDATARLGQDFLDVTFSYPTALGVLTWGPSDRNHWLRKSPDKQRADRSPVRAAPLDDQFRRKPLWHAIANAIDHAPARSK